MKPSDKGFAVGRKVVLLREETPYYSGYAGNPNVAIPQGSTGIVGATDVPYVAQSRDRGRGDYFVCVDFVLEGVFRGNPVHKQNRWRCGVNPKHLRMEKQP
jgi:hypothetical protein